MKNTKRKVKTALIIMLVLLSVFLIFLAALLIRTYTFSPAGKHRTGFWGNAEPAFAANFSLTERTQLLNNLKGALRMPTVARSVTDFNISALEEFRDYLPKVFPTVFSSNLVHHEIIANYSHLFTVRGSNDSLQPYMLIAHLDVVPVLEEEWEVPPFSAEEQNGYLYGRGTLDDKSSAMGILQALEFLFKRGYKPYRSFYIGIGHDEEVGGNSGAKNIATVLQSRGVKLSFLLDEGSVILNGVIPGLDKPAAVLENNPMPRMFGQGPERGLLEHLSSQLRFPLNVVMANLWLFAPLVSRMMETKPSTNSIIRTTTAVTEFHAGVKANVIAPSARATVNFRLHPVHKLQQLLNQIQNIISDERVKIEVLDHHPSLPMSSYDDTSFGYQVIKGTIGNIFPEVAVAPGLCIAGTDTKHYQKLTRQLYRFIPMILNEEDLTRIHGVNERISVKNYEEIVQFYFHLMQNSDIWTLPHPHSNSSDL
ncbi:N-fatty-acyl-amino acid synthase/hydrolase PM20D1.2-like isoform X2 [Heterodontus francisci]|uniref:N-fatty-acyl-amino acid synthase/hydrolase PM20D1.2-like isoform X2 n=1 Tax=Heterodontus francisci TaxID=7792 RepID=UPI00355B9FF9